MSPRVRSGMNRLRVSMWMYVVVSVEALQAAGDAAAAFAKKSQVDCVS